MYNIKLLKLLLFVLLLFSSLLYTVYPKSHEEINEYIEITTEGDVKLYYNETEDYLINTPGCYIPNYSKTMKIHEAKDLKKTCGERAVFITKLSHDHISFTIDEIKMSIYSIKTNYTCCYQFVRPSIISGQEDYTVLTYSKCLNFQNGTIAPLEDEVVTVTCELVRPKKKLIYKDAYAIIKKLNKKDVKYEGKSWNLLVLGMDTMSRGRVYSSMPKTINYFLKHNWLDYRGYQKVGFNTFPNVVSLLTGKNVSAVRKSCSPGMDKCNNLFTWSDFQKAGYATGTGEDFLRLPDTFSGYGYKSPPTDHYLRPLFLTGEYEHGNVVCTNTLTSGKHILDYSETFVDTYKHEKFFGFFWSNSYSHNLNNIPTLIDDHTVDLLTSLTEFGIMSNTFILFVSDHGLRFGDVRDQYESYYEERLPMLFLWVPDGFRKLYSKEYYNLKINQNRLITPYDVYLTMQDILIKSTNVSRQIKSEGCPNCQSLFNEISPQRHCADASVDERWCTCHKLYSIDKTDIDVQRSIKLAVTYLQNTMKNINTTRCMECVVLDLKKIVRTHTYRDESLNSTYYIIAFVMTPGDIGYEVVIVKRNEELTMMHPVYTISSYHSRGNCVINRLDIAYCFCKKIDKCEI